MSIPAEISRINEAKADIISALNDKGVVVSSSAPIQDMGDYIRSINTGGTNLDLDKIYPIGSIYMSNSSVSPEAQLGGEWELIDKEFAPYYGTITSDIWTSSNAALNGTYNNFFLNGHTIVIRLNLKNNVALTDNNVNLGTLSPAAFGVTSFYYTQFGKSTMSDGGNSMIYYRFTTEGNIQTDDIINADDSHTMATGNNFYINEVLSVPFNYMDNDFCNKFYWERIA